MYEEQLLFVDLIIMLSDVNDTTAVLQSKLSFYNKLALADIFQLYEVPIECRKTYKRLL